jgi:hypothetical protein
MRALNQTCQKTRVLTPLLLCDTTGHGPRRAAPNRDPAAVIRTPTGITITVFLLRPASAKVNIETENRKFQHYRG